jgi:hypothetical protein
MQTHGSDVRSIPSIEPDDHSDTDSDTPPPWPERESIDANVVPGGRGVVRLVERSSLPEGTIVYAYPGYFGSATRSSGALHMIYRTHPVASRNSDYIQYEADSPVPAGGRLVHFDPEMWLDECSRRIAPQPEDDEGASHRRHHRPMEPAVEDNSRQQCQAYLDDYMRSARSGGLHGLNSESGQYMLVPVTVLVPQRAAYGDGTPVRR